MGKVAASISISLDGFIAGPNDDLEEPLGEGGDRLHEWVYGLTSWRERHGLEGGTSNRDADVLDEAFRTTGAIVLGRRMFDLARGWGDEPPFHMPVFVLTHRGQDDLVKEGGTTFRFVTDGVESALEQARAAAGDQDVSVGGGASTIQQFIAAGLLDELQVHIVPVLLGAGRKLFAERSGGLVELKRIRVIDSPTVTHLKFRLVRT